MPGPLVHTGGPSHLWGAARRILPRPSRMCRLGGELLQLAQRPPLGGAPEVRRGLAGDAGAVLAAHRCADQDQRDEEQAGSGPTREERDRCRSHRGGGVPHEGRKGLHICRARRKLRSAAKWTRELCDGCGVESGDACWSSSFASGCGAYATQGARRREEEVVSRASRGRDVPEREREGRGERASGNAGRAEREGAGARGMLSDCCKTHCCKKRLFELSVAAKRA